MRTIKKSLFLTTLLFALASANCQTDAFPHIPETPEWLPKAVFYQIYPQSFKDSDGDGIGDLEGIISKLDYVKKLGANAIWINPFYESPFCDAGYDVADFYKVDRRYGDTETIKRLFEEAHKKGIKVILDFVVGHTSDQHPWFKASAKNDPKYKNWYIWTNDNFPIIKPKKYEKSFIKGAAPRNGMYMVNFFSCQPRLNFGFEEDAIEYDWQLTIDHPDIKALKDELKNIMAYWLDMGADGFRVDMAGTAGKNFWKEVRELFDVQYPEALLISEWGSPSVAVEAGFHADFMHWYRGYDDLYHKKFFTKNPDSYSFFEPEGKGNITEFLDAFLGEYQKLKTNGYISIPVDNHDMQRVKNSGRDDRDLEIIYAFQMTFPSIPFVYYGDEIGMSQLPLDTLLTDEGHYGTRAGNRTPMQWDSSDNFGFSTASKQHLYLPQDSQKSAPTASKQLSDKQSLFYKTQQLIELRKTENALMPYADFEVVYAKDHQYPFVYSRKNKDERILVVLNPSKQNVDISIPLDTRSNPELLMGTGVSLILKKGYTRVSCEGRSYGIFKY